MRAKMTPVLIVDLNLPTGALTNLTVTDTTHYGDVPQPILHLTWSGPGALPRVTINLKRHEVG